MSLLDFGFAEPQSVARNVHQPYTFKPPRIELEPLRMLKRMTVDFSRCSTTRAGYMYYMPGNKCPCGSDSHHGGGGPYDHSRMRILDEYTPGAVRYDGVITLDMAKMAKNCTYKFEAQWRRGKLLGVDLRVYRFNRITEEFAVTNYLETVLRPGDTA